MFARCARVVPAIASANVLFERGETRTTLPSTVTSTSGFVSSVKLPFLPLIVTTRPLTSALRSLPSSMGFLPTRDIVVTRIRGLENDAEDFAAVALRLGLNVRHDALRRRHDRDAESALHDGELIDALEDAQPGPAHALDALDDGFVLVVLQLERHDVLAFDVLGRYGREVAFLLEDLCNGELLLRRRQRHGGLACRLRVTDARQHVGDRVGHTHSGILTSWPSGRPESRRASSSRAASCATDRTCDSSRAAAPSTRSGCAAGSDSRRAAASAVSSAPRACPRRTSGGSE